MTKQNFKKMYRDIEMRVHFTLREKIEKSKCKSKFNGDNAIKVKHDNYCEIVIWSNGLYFYDNDGNMHSIFNVTLEELIELI